ncbi:hypothetical protein ACN28E_20715 [Archangium lansingense]|uniref:hypothetical protein n=1 Tax=Archangium lansingense TaxID=2995310 RepID=UPI003B81FA9D
MPLPHTTRFLPRVRFRWGVASQAANSSLTTAEGRYSGTSCSISPTSTPRVSTPRKKPAACQKRERSAPADSRGPWRSFTCRFPSLRLVSAGTPVAGTSPAGDTCEPVKRVSR